MNCPKCDGRLELIRGISGRETFFIDRKGWIDYKRGEFSGEIKEFLECDTCQASFQLNDSGEEKSTAVFTKLRSKDQEFIVRV